MGVLRSGSSRGFPHSSPVRRHDPCNCRSRMRSTPGWACDNPPELRIVNHRGTGLCPISHQERSPFSSPTSRGIPRCGSPIEWLWRDPSTATSRCSGRRSSPIMACGSRSSAMPYNPLFLPLQMPWLLLLLARIAGGAMVRPSRTTPVRMVVHAGNAVPRDGDCLAAPFNQPAGAPSFVAGRVSARRGGCRGDRR
jgi:hypothetical protein